MQPRRPAHVGLSDLLDRLLQKGLVLHADLVITLAGIPLIGVNLRAALAGMETMHRYGLMQDWDTAIRAQAAASPQPVDPAPLFSAPGAFFSTAGICPTWRYGAIYLTDRQLVVYHGGFQTAMLTLALTDITAIYRRRDHDAILTCAEAGPVLLRSIQIDALLQRLAGQGRQLARPIPIENAPPAAVTDTCPLCGRLDAREKLLQNGCRRCGWQPPLRADTPMEAIN